MRVAICGAGMAGLACAFQLEQLGFSGTIDIFEERATIGEGNIFAEFLAELFYRPIPDIFTFWAENYKLYLKPIQTITKSLNHGPTRMAHVEGFLGHIIVRGNHPQALEKQIYQQLQTPIRFNSQMKPSALSAEYDIVVVATGTLTDLPEAVNVRVDRMVHFYHALVHGNFDPSLVKLWLNHAYAPKGYGYFLPISKQQGMLSLATPVESFPLRQSWQKFLEEVWDNHLEIEHTHEIKNMPIGIPRAFQYRNFLFTGNTAGAITPGMGFGLIQAIQTGFHAAESIVTGEDYSKKLVKLKQEYDWSLSLRNALDAMGQEQYDMLIDGFDSLLGQRLLEQGSANILRIGGYLLSKLQNEPEYYQPPSSIPLPQVAELQAGTHFSDQP